MSPLTISGLVFLCICGGALLGMALHAILHERHLSAEAKDVVKLAMGLIATLSALVLGLLIASAKSAFEDQRKGLEQMAANVVLLDHTLSYYGPEAQESRDFLRTALAAAIARIWPEDGALPAQMTPTTALEDLYVKIQALTPKTDTQQNLQTHALKLSTELAQTRWLLFAQRNSAIPTPFLVVLVFWLMVLFASFTLFSRPGVISNLALLVCAISVAAAIFLILELDRPFAGIMQISNAPLRDALAQLGR